ncbi:hypothetical protein [Microbulbifer sp. ZKSA002]|uniref:hypothetical protein n=1 Tax=Microbulbifer sp. ZKSA002 TaxID=3243388 RepID=UPI00403A6E85
MRTLKILLFYFREWKGFSLIILLLLLVLLHVINLASNTEKVVKQNGTIKSKFYIGRSNAAHIPKYQYQVELKNRKVIDVGSDMNLHPGDTVCIASITYKNSVRVAKYTIETSNGCTGAQ